MLNNEMQASAMAGDNRDLVSISQNPDERARFLSRRICLQDREHEQAVAREEGREETRTEYEPLLAAKDAEIEALRALLSAQLKQLILCEPLFSVDIRVHIHTHPHIIKKVLAKRDAVW